MPIHPEAPDGTAAVGITRLRIAAVAGRREVLHGERRSHLASN